MHTASKPTRVVASLRTDVGAVREHNEDSACIDPAGMFFVVADGMGGHAAGEVASSMAVEEVSRWLEQARPTVEEFARSPGDEGRRRLVKTIEDAVRAAHRAVYERGGRESDKRGMGTTLDVLLVADGEAFIAHVGDSRTYLLRGGAAAPVTTDHTVAEVLVIEGKLTPEEARLSPLRTILVNAIGVAADVGVELAHLKLRRGDKLLLCSDGLHDYFPLDAEIAQVLVEGGGEDALGRLVQLAKDRGGHDNITGVLVEVVEGNPTVQEEEEEARQNAELLQPPQAESDRGAVPSSIACDATLPLPKNRGDRGSVTPAAAQDAPVAAPQHEPEGVPPAVGADAKEPPERT